MRNATREGVFISYRRADAAGEAGRLADHLAILLGTGSVFFDVVRIAGGDDWRQQLDAALDACDTMFIVIGRQWLGATADQRRIDDPNDMVAWEVAQGLARGMRVVQVLVQETRPLAAAELPPTIAGLAMRQAVELRHESFAGDVREMAEQIRHARQSTSPFAGEWRSSDMSCWVPRVLDSGAEGTVAAITIVNAMELLLARAGIQQRLSLRYLYEKTLTSQVRGVKGANTRETGVFMLPALFVAGFFGVPRESVWRYKPNVRDMPRGHTWETLDMNRGWCCRVDFFRVDGLADAVRHLAAGRPVITSVPSYDTWWKPPCLSTGVLPMPNPHAEFPGLTSTLLVGYSAKLRQFRSLFAWGKSWGDRGFGTIHLDVARRLIDPSALWSVELSADTVADLRAMKAKSRLAKPSK